MKKIYERAVQTNSQLKYQFLQFLPFFIASVLTGLMAFFYNKLFSFSEKLSFHIYQQNRAYLFITTPLAFLLSWWFANRFAPNAKGSGIPQVMAAIELAKPATHKIISRLVSLRIILIKIVSSCIKIMGGGILGREGPTVQISSSIFNQIYQWVPKWWSPISQKNILIAGAASGLAAAFNTPLGGIIFAIEELSKFHVKYYKYPLFIAIIIAGLTVQGFTGSYLYLGYPQTNISGYNIYAAIVLVAIVSGYFGALMCSLLLKFMHFFNSQVSQLKQAGLVTFAALFIAVIIYYLGTDAMGSGKDVMEKTLFTDNKTVAWYLPFIRMNGLIVSFGSGGAGGVFAPSLSAGASFGALTAELFNLSGSNANVLILVGMAGFLTAVVRAPFTSSIIIFEMTDRHSIIFLLFLATLISNIMAQLVDKRSFYEVLKESYLREVG